MVVDGCVLELLPRGNDEMVGATGLEPAISCSQSRRASHYATPRSRATGWFGSGEGASGSLREQPRRSVITPGADWWALCSCGTMVPPSSGAPPEADEPAGSTRMYLNGRALVFQTSYAGSIPVIRSRSSPQIRPNGPRFTQGTRAMLSALQITGTDGSQVLIPMVAVWSRLAPIPQWG